VAAESSFDIVSKLDRQEVDNALNQAGKEIANRFDFRNVDAGIKWAGEAIEVQANSEERALAVLDVLKDKLVKRSVSLKAIDAGEPKPSGKIYKLTVALKEGISQEDAKKIGKIIRDEGPKGVRAQIQGDELRVSSKKKENSVYLVAADENPDGKVSHGCYLSKELLDQGASANEWANAVAAAVGGKAGGKGPTSIGAGTNPSKVDEGLELATKYLEKFKL